MWCEEAVMTALSVLGDQFLFWASWNRLCAHVWFNLGRAGALRCCDWHPQVPPCKVQKLKLPSGPSTTYQPWCWETELPLGVGRMSSSHKNHFLGSPQFQFHWPFNSSSKLMKSGKRRCCVTPKCEQKQRNGASEPMSTRSSAFWDWESWKITFLSHKLKNSKPTKGFFSQYLLWGF